MRRHGWVFAFLFILLLPATAAAATRYASPTGGTTGDCQQGSPVCELQYAIGQAAADDTVELAGGTYTEADGDGYELDKKLTLIGAEGTRPLIQSTQDMQRALTVTGDAGFTLQRLALKGPADTQALFGGPSTLRDVVIDTPGECAAGAVGLWEDVTVTMARNGATCLQLNGGTLRRVAVTATGGANASGIMVNLTDLDGVTVNAGGVGISATGGTLSRLQVAGGSVGLRAQSDGGTLVTESLIRGADAVVAQAGGLILRNVSAVGSDRGVVVAQSDFPLVTPPGDATLTNVIARGSAADTDVVVLPCSALNPLCEAGAADVAFSNVRTTTGITLGAGVQTEDPRFVSAEDLHLQADSPAIDKGTADGVDPGTQDVDGDTRPTGAGVDIGGDEFVAPAPAPTATATPSPTATASPSPVPDTTKPRITKAKAIKRGRVRFTLSEAARVRIVATRKRGRKFRRYGRTTVAATPGRFTVRLRFAGRKLKPGRYKLMLRATDAAGNKSRKVTVRVRVRKR